MNNINQKFYSRKNKRASYYATIYTTNLKKWRVGNCPICHVPEYLSIHNLTSRIPDIPSAFKTHNKKPLVCLI